MINYLQNLGKLTFTQFQKKRLNLQSLIKY